MDNLKTIKDDKEKPRVSMIPTDVLMDIAKAFTYGANKYGEYNYSLGIEYTRLYDAAQRHMNSWIMGEDIDESTNHHIDHAIASLIMLKHQINNNKGTDNRNKIFKNE